MQALTFSTLTPTVRKSLSLSFFLSLSHTLSWLYICWTVNAFIYRLLFYLPGTLKTELSFVVYGECYSVYAVHTTYDLYCSPRILFWQATCGAASKGHQRIVPIRFLAWCRKCWPIGRRSCVLHTPNICFLSFRLRMFCLFHLGHFCVDMDASLCVHVIFCRCFFYLFLCAP